MSKQNDVKPHPSTPSEDGIYWVADTATNEIMVGWIQSIQGCTEPVQLPLEFKYQKHVYLQYMNVIPHPYWNGKLLDEFITHPDSSTMVWTPIGVPSVLDVTAGNRPAKNVYIVRPSDDWIHGERCRDMIFDDACPGRYMSIIVVAESPEDAVRYHPEKPERLSDDSDRWLCHDGREIDPEDQVWPDPADCIAREIGVATIEWDGIIHTRWGYCS